MGDAVFSIEIRGEALKMLEKRGVEPFQETIKLTAFALEGNIKRKINENQSVGATGQLQNLWFADPKSWNGMDYVVWSPLSYAQGVDEGRGPHTPDFGSLKAWARVKGVEDHVYAIYRSIQKKGTKPHPFVQPAIEMTTHEVDGYFNQALAKAGF